MQFTQTELRHIKRAAFNQARAYYLEHAAHLRANYPADYRDIRSIYLHQLAALRYLQNELRG